MQMSLGRTPQQNLRYRCIEVIVSTLDAVMFGAIGIILILIGLTIAKQMVKRNVANIERGRTSLGKDLSEE